METGRKPCACVLCQCLLGRLGPQGLARRFGQAGSARWGPLARSCAESALVPRDPSPSAEALLPTASPTLSWSQWRSAPASPAACECRAWGLGEGLGWLRRAVVSVVVAIGARTGGSYQEHQCAAGTCWGQHGNRLISASSRPHRCAAPAWGRVWGLGPGWSWGPSAGQGCAVARTEQGTSPTVLLGSRVVMPVTSAAGGSRSTRGGSSLTGSLWCTSGRVSPKGTVSGTGRARGQKGRVAQKGCVAQVLPALRLHPGVVLARWGAGWGGEGRIGLKGCAPTSPS